MYNQNYISHHGIKGQKWGVRRYQNKDGSITNAGKKKNKIGMLQPVYKTLLDTSKLLGGGNEEFLKKGIDSRAKLFGYNDVEKLNIYNDYKQLGARLKRKRLAEREDFLSDNPSSTTKFMESLAGSSVLNEAMNMGIKEATVMHEFSTKRVNEFLEKLKDEPIKKVESNRVFSYGDSRYYWKGTKYIRAK